VVNVDGLGGIIGAGQLTEVGIEVKCAPLSLQCKCGKQENKPYKFFHCWIFTKIKQWILSFTPNFEFCRDGVVFSTSGLFTGFSAVWLKVVIFVQN